MKKSIPNILTIAGSDSSGGAGIQADIKTMSAMGGYAAAVITALTAQNTQGVMAIHAPPAEFVAAQLDAVFSDLTISAVKIGMIYNCAIQQVIIDALRQYKPAVVVIDPVMVATTGAALTQSIPNDNLNKNLFSLATLVTPNIAEAEILAGILIHDKDSMQEAASYLAQRYQTNVLIKGGHLQHVQAVDVLYEINSRAHYWFQCDYIATRHTHGTGCTLSSAIATQLALGQSLNSAIMQAKRYVTQALCYASQLQVGQGNGPVNHLNATGEKKKR